MVSAEEIQSVNQSIQQISQSESQAEIMDIYIDTLKSSGFYSFQFLPARGLLELANVYLPGGTSTTPTDQVTFPIQVGEHLIQEHGQSAIKLSDQQGLPDEVRRTLINYGCLEAVTLPIYHNGRIHALYLLASQQSGMLSAITILPYASLTAFTSTVLEKVQTTRRLNRRVAALQSLAKISQAISVVTDLNELFEAIHEQIIQVMGEVDLAIALYDPGSDMISIPYAHEAGEKISLDAFPLGQGLTSILIRTQQPLMLVEDTERKALELGAKIAGAAAKSWLGVPLIVSNEVFGAFILQDTFNEHRFDDDDLRLMTTLASQVAITIRNVRLLQDTRRRAEVERIIGEITTKIWASQDIETVARTTLYELGRALKAADGKIYLANPSVQAGDQSPLPQTPAINLPDLGTEGYL
jgi:GAF domain-containing protein